MKLIELLKNYSAIKNVKIGYLGEDKESLNEKISSDISVFAFTDEGIEHFNDVIELQIGVITEENEILLDTSGNIKSQNSINDFWAIFTRFGPYRWDTPYEYIDDPKKHTVMEMIEHRRYFTFTSEMQLNS